MISKTSKTVAVAALAGAVGVSAQAPAAVSGNPTTTRFGCPATDLTGLALTLVTPVLGDTFTCVAVGAANPVVVPKRRDMLNARDLTLTVGVTLPPVTVTVLGNPVTVPGPTVTLGADAAAIASASVAAQAIIGNAQISANLVLGNAQNSAAGIVSSANSVAAGAAAEASSILASATGAAGVVESAAASVIASANSVLSAAQSNANSIVAGAQATASSILSAAASAAASITAGVPKPTSTGILGGGGSGSTPGTGITPVVYVCTYSIATGNLVINAAVAGHCPPTAALVSSRKRRHAAARTERALSFNDVD